MDQLYPPGLLCPSLCVDIGGILLSVGSTRQNNVRKVGTTIAMVT